MARGGVVARPRRRLGGEGIDAEGAISCETTKADLGMLAVGFLCRRAPVASVLVQC